MAVKKMNAAPAPKTPFLKVAQERVSPPIIPLYFVWQAFLTEPASKQISAIKKNNLKGKVHKINSSMQYSARSTSLICQLLDKTLIWVFNLSFAVIMILNSANSAYEHCQVYLRLYIKRSIWYEHIPAGNEENNCPGS